MTLQQTQNNAIDEAKKDFDFYVDELGYNEAKNFMLNQTGYSEVIDYINNYNNDNDLDIINFGTEFDNEY